jgi:hypothetical protein
MRSLQIMDPNISSQGILNEWFPSAQNEEEWYQRIENIFINEKEPPRKRTRRFKNLTESEHHPEMKQRVHLLTPRAIQPNHDDGETNFPFPPESEFERQTLDHTPSWSRLNFLATPYLPQYYPPHSQTTNKYGAPPRSDWTLNIPLDPHHNNRKGIINGEPLQYMDRCPPPLAIPITPLEFDTGWQSCFLQWQRYELIFYPPLFLGSGKVLVRQCEKTIKMKKLK